MNRTIIILLALVPFMTMCRPKATSTEPVALPVEVLIIDSTTSVITHNYVGRAEDADVISLSFGVAGIIERIDVHNGDYVQAGQQLIVLDATKSRSLLATAEAKLQQAQDGYNRAKMVYNEGGVSEIKMMEITTQLHEAEQLVIALRNQVEDCTLRAPMAGVIGDLHWHVGQNILPDVQMLKLHNRTSKRVVYTVPEQDIAQVQAGDPVSVRIPALGDRQWQGRVTERSLSANTMAHSYEVKCLLEGNTTDILPGMNCQVQSQKDRISGYSVPAHCVQTMGDGLFVWVCRHGEAHRVGVESACFGREGVLISRGLNRGDSVIVSGYQKLYHGAKVNEKK